MYTYDEKTTSLGDFYRYTVFWHPHFFFFFFSSRDYLLAMFHFRDMPFIIKDLIL